jgi:hypothetical protein
MFIDRYSEENGEDEPDPDDNGGDDQGSYVFVDQGGGNDQS